MRIPPVVFIALLMLGAFGLNFLSASGHYRPGWKIPGLSLSSETGGKVMSFSTGYTRYETPGYMNPEIDYRLNPAAEKYFVYVPSDYNRGEQYGLIVFTSSADAMTALPPGWQGVLEKRKYIFVAPQNAGNRVLSARRMGLSVLGAIKAAQAYTIDPRHVFAAGISGGARTAGMLGFSQWDIFRGTIQSCGADFYKEVPPVLATSHTDSLGNHYGVLKASAEDVAHAKEMVKFALITGPGDFRHGNILDIFHGGFEAEGFHAKLFDVPGMGHTTANADTLSAALDYLESGQ